MIEDVAIWVVRIENIGMPDYAVDTEMFGVKTGFKAMCYFISYWVEKNPYNFVKIRLV
jgi:hypothetical protein